MQEVYEVPIGEEQYYHCEMEIKAYRTNQFGEPIKVSKPFVQKFERVWFRTVGYHELKQQGYSISILHDPYKHEEVLKEKAEAGTSSEEKPKVKKKAE